MFYLDANASVPVTAQAERAFAAALKLPGNPSSPHAAGRAARMVLDEAREAVAKALGGRDKDVFFTSGASEGNRWFVDAVVQWGAQLGRPAKVVSSKLEHSSLAKALKKASDLGQIDLTLGLENIADADVVFATAAHNETGLLADWSALLAQLPAPTILISDASQAMARVDVLPARVDGIVVSAHKTGAIVGSGAVLLRGNARKLPAPWAGGGQEMNLRPGSESVPLIAAFGAVAADIDQVRAEHQKLAALRDEVEQKLLAAWPNARALCAEQPRLPNTSAITLKNVDGEALRMAIDMAGVCVGFGSACSALAPEPSAALLALGLTPQEARATIRISLYPEMSHDDVMQAVQQLIPVVQKLSRK